VNADLLVSADKSVQKKYIEKWNEFVLLSFTKQHARHNYGRYLREDRPPVLSKELQTLKTAGFRSTELFWKYYNFAVYCAVK
jgi:hypothetical protein